jgi:Putative DNA-binding domain
VTRLRPLQREFADYILGGGETVRRHVRPSSRADIDTLLDVYRHAYAARLVEILGNDFPALKALAGDAAFADLARVYIAGHPSQGFSVRTAGNRLASFLAGASPWNRHPELADMAAFEWALAHAFDAADAEPIAFARMAAIPAAAWPNLVLVFHPSVIRVALRTSVPDAWRAHGSGEVPSEPQPQEGEWLVWRAGLDPRFRPLDEDEAAALDIAMCGGDFASLCATLAERGPEDRTAFRAAGLVRAWIDAGLIVDLTHGGALSG